MCILYQVPEKDASPAIPEVHVLESRSSSKPDNNIIAIMKLYLGPQLARCASVLISIEHLWADPVLPVSQ